MFDVVKYFLEDDNSDLSSDDETEISKNMIGKIYNSRYISLKYLGRGSFSKVWLVFDFETNNFYALKSYHDEYNEDALNEIKIMKLIDNKEIDNSRIIKVIDYFKHINNDTSSYCIVYELYGISLLDVFTIYQNLKEVNRLPYNNIIDIFKKLLLCLKEVHKKHIIHYDIKLENILTNIESRKVKFIKNWFLKKNPLKIYNYFIGHFLPDNYYNYKNKDRHLLICKAKVKTMEKIGEYFNFSEIDNIELINTDINIDDIELKITDFGNSDISTEFLGITQCYKAPENILNNYICTKSDIWVLGCVFYELLTNEYLFNFENNIVDTDKNILHLNQMKELFGYFPNYYEKYEEYKNYKKDLNSSEKINLIDILQNEFNYSYKESFNFSDILQKMLNLDFKERYNIDQCLSHDIFK